MTGQDPRTSRPFAVNPLFSVRPGKGEAKRMVATRTTSIFAGFRKFLNAPRPVIPSPMFLDQFIPSGCIRDYPDSQD